MITRLAEKSIHRMGSLCFRRAETDARARFEDGAQPAIFRVRARRLDDLRQRSLF